MGMSWAEHSVEIDAPIEIAFEAIVDYESFPSWQNAVDSVEVVDRHEDGLGRNVHLFVDAKVRKIDYVLRYRYARPALIEWDFVEGNGMRDMDGLYTFERLSTERTRATYKLGADPEIPVPGVVARRVHKQLVRRSVEDLKREAERRAAATEAPEADSAAPTADEAEAAIDGSEAAAGEADEVVATPAGGDRTEAPSEPWVPKAARERAAAGGRPERDHGHRLRNEVADRAATATRDVARAGGGLAIGALRLGVELGRDVIGRVDRRLSSRERDEEPRG
jgi:uncharacterized membrane protein